MRPLDVNYYQTGDIAHVEVGGTTTPARIVGRSLSPNRLLKVAISLPRPVYHNPHRIFPAGTPVFWMTDPLHARLISHDPGWNPYAARPFLSPDEYQVISGLPKTRQADALCHVGAYIPTSSYANGDPVWVWEQGWQAAVVVNVDRRWINVRYRRPYRNPKGQAAKSYRSQFVWPVLCDFPQTQTTIYVGETLLSARHLVCRVESSCKRPGESGCGRDIRPQQSELPSWLRVVPDFPPPWHAGTTTDPSVEWWELSRLK